MKSMLGSTILITSGFDDSQLILDQTFFALVPIDWGNDKSFVTSFSDLLPFKILSIVTCSDSPFIILKKKSWSQQTVTVLPLLLVVASALPALNLKEQVTFWKYICPLKIGYLT